MTKKITPKRKVVQEMWAVRNKRIVYGLFKLESEAQGYKLDSEKMDRVHVTITPITKKKGKGK